ncbi:hypothetical protein RUM44_007674 [Polyplax serrata]|uniref:STI1 domain-containing protein n=1 Tax=Polyplax serrata TaxID=468196 RepID=A0ABR1B866_POLSC
MFGFLQARKLEEHQRKYERKRLEKEVKGIRERIRKMREEQQKRAAEMKDNRHDSDDEGVSAGQGGGLGGMGDFMDILKDSEVRQAFEDPEVAAALQDLSQNPANILKYQKNPKINAILMKLRSKLANVQIPGGLGGAFPGFFGAQPGGPNAQDGSGGPRKPPSASDIDLD